MRCVVGEVGFFVGRISTSEHFVSVRKASESLYYVAMLACIACIVFEEVA